MNSIEMSDVDGDALTFISHEDRTWITCTSGADEVTVGPFSTRLLRGAISPQLEGMDQVAATLVTNAPAPDLPGADARERAWAAFTRQAETGSLREALDSALATALTADEPPQSSSELAQELRHAEIAITDPDALARHLLALGYRKM